jgi:magnesium-transporting ATPase (P-type)
MSFLNNSNEKNDEKYQTANKNQQNESNEIKLIKRTLLNNTHEVIEDTKLKRITSWRKSQSKFLKNLIYNILSFGILHLISLFYPNLYIKLYCNPCQGKDCDFFLVEDIYGYYTLCLKIHKKGYNDKSTEFNTTKDTFITSLSSSIPNKKDYYLTRNLTYSFTYKSMSFEYNVDTNEIIPVYMNLSKMTNRNIFNFFNEGLYSENRVMKFRQRYGLNEYYINSNILYYYFKRVEIPNFVLVAINGFVELFLQDYFSFSIKILFIILLFFLEIVIFRKLTNNLCENDYTIDGEQNLRVKRNYLMNNDGLYVEIKNKDLLPGDILFLKSDDIVPCDCLIMEGECIANESNSTGSLDIFKKISIENNNEQFSYKYNNINILFHGMKIVKTISKLSGGYISVLCINTGPNTYKANQYSDILYFSEKNKNFSQDYNFFGGERKTNFIIGIIIFFLSIGLGIGYIILFHLKMADSFVLVAFNMIRLFCFSLMPVYYMTHSLMVLSSVFRLNKKNIFCYDKSKLINNSGRIDTIFLSKTGTLCHNTFEIKAYHPAFINSHKQNSINYTTYKQNQCKEMNIQLINYYKDYIKKKNIINNTTKDFNLRYAIRKNPSILNKNYSKKNNNITLFIECLLSCNNLDKFNTEIFGNVIESKIFNDMKWDIKIHDNPEYLHNINAIDNLNKIRNRANSNNTFMFENKSIYINKKIYDIFPKNYYKITELAKNDLRNKERYLMKKIANKNLDKLSNINSLNSDISMISANINPILNDINTCDINSYKLRIFKKFIMDGSLNSSAIVYNFLTKELRFMIKGMAEDILDKCDTHSLPENFVNTISYYRRKGFIIIICASKLINVDEYNDYHDYEYYLNNLSFCGFITLKNVIKDDIRDAINELKQLNCKLIITSGDNEYNCLSVGFDSGIIDNKNIFLFDKDDKSNRIIIRKIYNIKSSNYSQEDEAKKSSYSPEKLSRQKPKMAQAIYVPLLKKESKELRNNKSLIAPSNTKKSISDKDNIDSKEYENKKKEAKILNMFNTPQIKPEIKFISLKTKEKRRSIFENNNSLNLSNLNENYIPSKNDNGNVKNNSNNSEENVIFQNEEKDKSNSKRKSDNKKYQESSNSHKKSKNSTNNKKSLITRKKSLLEFETFYYYNGILNEYEDLKQNCIYCVSGKALNYLYKNRRRKDFKILLRHIHKYCKIFFRMSAFDKSLSIDFYKEYPNSYICKIGECQSDFSPIMISNVGINLRQPRNFNTILCHFYTKDADIICIKNIIMEGRIIDQSTALLKISSYFCTLIINSYILTCLMRNHDIIVGQLNVLEITFLLLSILTFTGEPDDNSISNPLIKNYKLFNIHFYVQIIGLFLFKLLTVYFACRTYKTNREMDIKKIDKIFITYYFILSIELIFSVSFSLNFISFSRRTFLSKILYLIIILLLIFYFIDLISLNGSNFKEDIFKITYFEYFQKLFDSFDDENRITLFLVCLADFVVSILYTCSIYFIFVKISRKQQKK